MTFGLLFLNYCLLIIRGDDYKTHALKEEKKMHHSQQNPYVA